MYNAFSLTANLCRQWICIKYHNCEGNILIWVHQSSIKNDPSFVNICQQDFSSLFVNLIFSQNIPSSKKKIFMSREPSATQLNKVKVQNLYKILRIITDSSVCITYKYFTPDSWMLPPFFGLKCYNHVKSFTKKFHDRWLSGDHSLSTHAKFCQN